MDWTGLDLLLAFLGVGDGTGGFTFNPLFISADYNPNDIGDLNGDVKEDGILYNGATGNAATGISNGTGGPGYDSVIPEEVTGDLKADVILYDSLTGTEYTGISNGDATFIETYSYWRLGKTLAR